MKDLHERYKEELTLFKESASVFADEHPSITENLVRDTLDPDADMLLKSMAYMSARLRGELEQQFPSALQSISQVLVPDLMQPTPASTVLSFSPKSNLINPHQIRAGKRFSSTPVGEDKAGNSIRCWFTNDWDVEVLPIAVADVSIGSKTLANHHHAQVLSLAFTATRNPLENFDFKKLRLYFSLPNAQATSWIFALAKFAATAWVENADQHHTLHQNGITLPGMSQTGGNALETGVPEFNIHKLLQDYYLSPEKLLFVDVDLAEWTSRQGNAFTLNIALQHSDFQLMPLEKHHVHLFAAPASNQFKQFAEPVSVNLFDSEIKVQVRNRQLSGTQAMQVCDIVQVLAMHKGQQRPYQLENVLQPKNPNKRGVYYSFFQKPAENSRTCQAVLGLHRHRFEGEIEQLRIETMSTQGHWGSLVKNGQVTEATSDSPEIVSFTNITDASPFMPATIVNKEAWQIVSDQRISHLAFACADELQTFLIHYLPSADEETAKQKANLHRIQSISAVYQTPVDEIINNHLIRGTQFSITLSFSRFNGLGDLYMFLALLNAVIAYKTPVNTFSKVQFIDEVSQEMIDWSTNLLWENA